MVYVKRRHRIDGGNSIIEDNVKTAKKMEGKGIISLISEQVRSFIHTGQSFMCGGDPEVFKTIFRKMLESIATNGCLYTGKTGSGWPFK